MEIMDILVRDAVILDLGIRSKREVLGEKLTKAMQPPARPVTAR